MNIAKIIETALASELGYPTRDAVESGRAAERALKEGGANVLIVDDRERDTIIAALRLWQHNLDKTTPNFVGLDEIAENGRKGGDVALLSSEIDDLIEERINV